MKMNKENVVCMYMYLCVYIYVCVCMCVCVYVYSEVSVLKKKEFCDNMDEPWHDAKWKNKKKVTEGQILHDTTYIRNLK